MGGMMMPGAAATHLDEELYPKTQELPSEGPQEMPDFSMTTDDMIVKLKRLKKLILHGRRVKALDDRIKSEMAELEGELVIAMDNSSLESMKVEGKTMYRRNDTYFSLKAETTDDGKKWLVEHEYGDLIKETVNSKSLTSALKELPEDAIPEEFFNISKVKRIRMR